MPPLEPLDDRSTIALLPRPSRDFDDVVTDVVGEPGLHAQPTVMLPRRLMPIATSPTGAMRLDELERTCVFLKVVYSLCVGTLITTLASDGDPIACRVDLIGSVCSFVGALWVHLIVLDRAGFETRRLFVPGVLIVVGTLTGAYYWGITSPVAAMVIYGVYFFSLGSCRRATLAMYLIVALGHGALGVAVVVGAIADRGVISLSHLPMFEQLTILAFYEALYFGAFITARASQRATFRAMTSLLQAAGAVAQRDAMLAEARADLDRALKIGAPGPYTGQIVGSFRLGVLIGRGAMGEVYDARGADHGEAAVKLLHSDALRDRNAVQRFVREARLAARIDCPHVVRVLDVGTTGADTPFLAMERLHGHDLAHQLRRHRRLGLASAQLLAAHTALGLEAARAAGIVHRDLKPQNVFLAEAAGRRRWKILDFGVSKSGGTGTLTKGHIVGTPAYMAPEQARGENVDHRADVYSLAAILYRAITGHPAFSGKDVPTTLYEVVYRVPTRPSLLALVSSDVDRVLAIGLAKDPADRFATALELARWFAAAVDGALSLDKRRRGDDLIARFPWGTRRGA